MVGDADYICNYMGFEAVVNALNTTITPAFKKQAFQKWTVAGQNAGMYKNAGVFSYVRILGAGHEVAAYTTGASIRIVHCVANIEAGGRHAQDRPGGASDVYADHEQPLTVIDLELHT
jgi:carboxypeptidase C (cathepsin A)